MVRRELCKGSEPPRRRMRGEPLHPSEGPVGASVALDQSAVRVETRLEADRPVEHPLHDPAAFAAEVDRRADPLRGEGQALTRGISDGLREETLFAGLP